MSEDKIHSHVISNHGTQLKSHASLVDTEKHPSFAKIQSIVKEVAKDLGIALTAITATSVTWKVIKALRK